MGLPLRRYRVVGHAGLALLLLAAVKAQAASSVLIWPIDPVLEADQQASALWLENRGNETANLQIRVFAWSQSEFNDQYQNQRDVIGSPPVAKIEPGQKQLVRLTRTREVPPGQELAYRIIIDEIPSAAAPTAEEGKTAAAIRFQMRYSVPLFVYGQGLWGKPDADGKRDAAGVGKPLLESGHVPASLARAVDRRGGASASRASVWRALRRCHGDRRWQNPAGPALGNRACRHWRYCAIVRACGPWTHLCSLPA